MKISVLENEINIKELKDCGCMRLLVQKEINCAKMLVQQLVFEK